MFASSMRLSRLSVSVSGAMLVLGATPGVANSASCVPTLSCVTEPLSNQRISNTHLIIIGTGGVLSDSTVNNGRIHLYDSGRSTGIRVEDRGLLQLFDNGVAQDSIVQNNGLMEIRESAKALRTTVEGGASLQLFDAALAENSTVKSKGQMDVQGTAKAIRSTVEADGQLVFHDMAVAEDSIVQNSGRLGVLNSAIALRTNVDGGNMQVEDTAVARDTRLNGGALWVKGSATAEDTHVNNGRMTVYESGQATRTTVNGGGVLSVRDNAQTHDTIVYQYGLIDSVAGTHVHRTTVSAGGTMVLGDGAAAIETTIHQGGELHLKGDAALSGNNQFDGVVRFAPPLDSFHTLTIDGPLSGNGSFLMNTDLTSRQGDLLKVLGSVSNSHTLVVADSGNAPADAQQGLMLVDGNGGDGDFKLHGQTVDAGAYRYELRQQGDDWYLANLNMPNVPNMPEVPDAPDAPDAPGTPATPATPNDIPKQKPTVPEAQTLSKGANAAVASHAASAALISAQMNATTAHFGELRSGKDKGGVWTRTYGVEQHVDTGTSRAFKQQINGLEIGADQALPLDYGTLYLGGLIGQGRADQDFGEASKGKIDSTTLGGYASYQDHSGLYVDGALKYSYLDNNINITSNLGDKVKASYRNHAVSADVQLGKHIELGQGWFAEPQAGLQLAHISGASYTAANGLSVEQDSMLSVQSRVGGTLGRDLQMPEGLALKPFAKATWVTEHAGDSLVKVSNAKLDSRLPGSRAEMAGGVMVTVADKHNVFAEAGYVKGNTIEQPWAATVGYRYNW